MKKIRRWVTIGLVVWTAIIGGVFLWWKMNDEQQVVRLHGHTYHIAVMRTEEELEHGLSGTPSLPADHAMLFVFPYDTKWAMWMKDMKYSLDIVWLDANRTVIHMEKNLSPDTYPDEYRSETASRYVIELPSGTIEKTGIQLGDPAGFPSGV
jgi:uncharacterized membrane protein (UPF0127 family)